MTTTEIVIAVILTCLLALVLIRVVLRKPELTLEQKFAEMGVLAGKTRAEIEAVAGPPNSCSVLPEDQMLLQWMSGGYHVALVFENEECKGLSHECSV